MVPGQRLVQLNRARSTDPEDPNPSKLDWSKLGVVSGPSLPASFSDVGSPLTGAIDLYLEGDVVFGALGLVAGKGSFEITMGRVGVDTDSNGTADVTYEALVMSLQNIQLFVGPGTSVTIGETYGTSSVSSGTLGFSASGVSIDLPLGCGLGFIGIPNGNSCIQPYRAERLRVAHAPHIGLQVVILPLVNGNR